MQSGGNKDNALFSFAKVWSAEKDSLEELSEEAAQQAGFRAMVVSSLDTNQAFLRERVYGRTKRILSNVQSERFSCIKWIWNKAPIAGKLVYLPLPSYH